MNKLKHVLKITSTIFTIILMLFSILLLIPRLFGLKPLNISGSLSYTNENYTPQNINLNDTIAFVITDGVLETSQVSSIKLDANTFLVDNNKKIVYFENYIGKVNFKIPLMGHIVEFINTVIGKIILVITLLLLIGIIIMTTTKPEEEKNKEQ